METKPLYIIFLLFLWINMACMAVPIKTICGEYTYVVPDNVSREEAKRIAAERARLDALAMVYGTLVSQDNTTFISNRNGESDIVFQSLGGSDVRGEWLGDIPMNLSSVSSSMSTRARPLSMHAYVASRVRSPAAKCRCSGMSFATVRNPIMSPRLSVLMMTSISRSSRL